MPPVHRHASVKPAISRPKKPDARRQPHQQFTRTRALRLLLGDLALGLLDSNVFHVPAPLLCCSTAVSAAAPCHLLVCSPALLLSAQPPPARSDYRPDDSATCAFLGASVNLPGSQLAEYGTDDPELAVEAREGDW
ncbi:MAG: hypothetical protein ACHRXM_39065 [Isosphaerales bacterium]